MNRNPIGLVLLFCLTFASCVCPRKGASAPGLAERDFVPAERVTARALRVFVREYAYGGDEIRVRILHEGKPVWTPTDEPGVSTPVRGVRVEFAGLSQETDADGVAVFRIPDVRRPEAFVVDVSKSGYASYVTRVISGRRFAFPVFPSVYVFQAPGVLYDLKPDLATKLKRLDIVDATGATEASLNPKNVEAKLEGTGVNYDRETDCGEQTVLDSLRAAGPGSVWVFHGHGNDSDGDGKTDSLVSDEDEVITLEELCAAMRDTPPDVVILSGCGDADFLQRLKECGPKLVLGFDRRILHGNAAKAVTDLLEGLLDGETSLAELIQETTRKGRVRAGAMLRDTGPAEVTFCGYPPPDGDKKLGDFLSDPPQ